MRTHLHFKIVCALICLPFIAFANNSWKGRYTKEKTIKKEFSVSSNTTLEIDNSYGNLDITTWDENRIEIVVSITTNGNNEEKVQKKLDNIDVDFSESSNYVSAETKFNKNKSRSWWNWGNNNVNMKINYTIKMPMSNNVKLSNDYGAIDIDKLKGRAEISCDYGKITTKELMADNNDVRFAYTNNCYFEYIKSGEVNADYSSYTISKAKTLDINANYTKSTIENAENVIYKNDYGSLKVDNINNIEGNGDYLTLRLGNVYGNIAVKADYGSFKIDNLAANAGNVNIQSDYMKITIGYDAAYSFDFEFDLEYASLRGGDNFEYNKKIVKSMNKYYQGYHGKANSGNSIKITSDYGSLNFNQN